MEYYIVMNEWNYPTELGREFIGDFDDAQDAEYHAKDECEREYDNFLSNTNGEYYREASGRMVDAYGNCEGYILHSSKDESEDFFFRSIIIKREVI